MMISSQSNKFNKLVLVSVISLAFGLSSCGGDGGEPPPSTNVTDVTIGGTAAKGIVKNGVVTAKELDASGDVLATVGNTTTGNDGTYSLTLNDDYNGGPVQISITTDGNTEMKCDVPLGCGASIIFGGWYKPAAFTMTALVPDAESNETLSVSVTPFTHMAAVRAMAAATLDATAIANANSEVSNLLGGIDILNTAPVDITDSAAVDGASSATQITYAALSSALSNQGLIDGNGQPKLNETINFLADSFAGGIIIADDIDGDDAAQISLQEIVTAAEETFAAAGILDLTGKLDGMQAGIDFAEEELSGLIDPPPGDTVADPKLDKVKAMVSDIRTWGNVITAETQAKSSAFEVQVTLASDAISILGTTDLSNALDAALEAALNFTTGITDLTDPAYDMGLNSFTGGTIDSATTGEVTISDGLVHGYTVDMIITLPEDGTNVTIGTSFTLGVSSTTISSINNTMTINSGTVDMTLAGDLLIDYADLQDPLSTTVIPDPTDLVFDLDVAFTQNVDSLGASLASPVSFVGTLSFDLDMIPVLNNPLEEEALPKTLNLSGTLSNTLGDSVTATLAANVTNTATFQFYGDAYPVGTLYSAVHPGESLVSWTYTDTDSTEGNDTFTYITPHQNQSLYWNAVNTNVTNSYTYQNYFTNLTDLVVNNVSFWQPYAYEAEGDYTFDTTGADLTVDGSLGDGVLTFSYDEVSFPIGTLYSANHAPTHYWAYTDTDAIAGNDTFTYTTPWGSESYYWNATDNTITRAETWQSGYASLNVALANSGYTPYDVYTWIDGEGEYFASVFDADFSIDGVIPGELVNPEYIDETDTANGWIDADVGLTFTVQLDGLPQASINITADRTGFEAGDGDVTISYGNRQLALSATVSNNQVDGLLTITNQDNVVMTLNLAATDATLLNGGLNYNEIKYADVEETASGFLKISYTDGTFEIF